MPLSPSLLSLVARIGETTSVQRRGRFHSSLEFFEEGDDESSSRSVIDGAFDLEAERFALTEEAREGSRTVASERRVFVREGLLYERSSHRYDRTAGPDETPEALVQALDRLADGVGPNEDRWLRQPLEDSMVAIMQDNFLAVGAKAEQFTALVGSAGLRSSLEAAAPGRLALTLRGPLAVFPGAADTAFAFENPDIEMSMSLVLDLEHELIEAVRLNLPMPATVGGRVETAFSFYGYGRPVSIEMPPEEECYPELPPLAGSVKQISSGSLFYTLTLELGKDTEGETADFSGCEIEVEVCHHDQFGSGPSDNCLTREPATGEQLWVSGGWRPRELDFEAQSQAHPSESHPVFSADCLLASDGYLYDLLGGLPGSELLPRDEHGLLVAPVMAKATTIKVSDRSPNYEIELISDDGQLFYETLSEEQWSRPRVGERVILGRSWNAGEEVVAYAERPDGTLLFGAKPGRD
jgi:hypothetical protein